MLSYLFRIFISMIGGVVLGVIGMVVGAWFGGNFATEVVFNGVRGYEATSSNRFYPFFAGRCGHNLAVHGKEKTVSSLNLLQQLWL